MKELFDHLDRHPDQEEETPLERRWPDAVRVSGPLLEEVEACDLEVLGRNPIEGRERAERGAA